MIPGPVIKRYARALLSLCEAQGNAEEITADLQRFVAAYDGSDELRVVVRNPVLPLEVKRATVDAVIRSLSLAPLARNFITLLLDRHRLTFLPAISAEIKHRIDMKAGRLRAEVTSAMPLSETELERATQALRKISGSQNVIVETRVDPAIIGGLVTRIGNVVLDGSVRNQIEGMRDHLLANG